MAGGARDPFKTMETTTSFDLNRAVAQWRENLAQLPAFQYENLEELESHLRDSVATLAQRGLTGEEAFLIATRRAGSGAVLGAEYGKVNAPSIWLNRLLWMLIGIQAYWALSDSERIITEWTVVLTLKEIFPWASASNSQLFAGVLAGVVHLAALAALLAVFWRLWTRNNQTISSWFRGMETRKSRMLAIAGAGMVVIFFPYIISASYQIYFLHYSRQDLGGMQWFSAIQYGAWIASLIQNIALLAGTLWLARRQLKARAGS